MADWEAGLAARDPEALWRIWCEAAEAWLVGWTGKTDPSHFGRARARRVRRLPAEGQRGPVGFGEAGRRAQGWLKAWRWLQELSRAVTQGGVVAELKVRRLLALLGRCLPGLGAEWVERQFHIPGATPEVRMEWAAEAEREFLKVQAVDAAERRAAWRKWVLGAVKDRPGLLYRWVKGEAQAPKTATRWTGSGPWTRGRSSKARRPSGEASGPRRAAKAGSLGGRLGLLWPGWMPPRFGKLPGG